jgi:hypothetical protein
MNVLIQLEYLSNRLHSAPSDVNVISGCLEDLLDLLQDHFQDLEDAKEIE